MVSTEIYLSDFLEFTGKVGMPRVTKVKELKDRPEYQPAFDFYKPLREQIQAVHEHGDPLTRIGDLLPTLNDPKKSETTHPSSPVTKARDFLRARSRKLSEDRGRAGISLFT